MGMYSEAASAAKKAGTAVSLKPVWTPFKKQGQTICGLLKGKETVEGRTFKGSFVKYTMDTDEGMIQFKMGSASDKDIGVGMEIGEIYEISFEGQTKLDENSTRNDFECIHIMPIDLTK